MSVTIELPAEAEARLQAEASRRGISVDQVVAEFAAQLPGEAPGHRLSFVAIGASGRTEPLDVKQERSELVTKKLAEGI
jgi:hypothetical protein